jgi:hypothetical protein
MDEWINGLVDWWIDGLMDGRAGIENWVLKIENWKLSAEGMPARTGGSRSRIFI